MTASIPLPLLLRRIEYQDEAAFSEFHGVTSPLLKAFLTRMLKHAWNCEEVMQDVYLYVWQNAAAYSPVRGTPLTWLYTLGRSRALDSWRKNKRSSANVEFDDYISGNAAFVVRGEIADVWSHDRIRESVALLPPARKQILDLAFAEGYTHSEIAAATGLPLGTVKTWIRSALGQIKGMMLPGQPGQGIKSLPFAA